MSSSSVLMSRRNVLVADAAETDTGLLAKTLNTAERRLDRETTAERFQGAKLKRLLTPLPSLAVLLLIGACSLPANEGLVPRHDHPQQFAGAHAACWEKSMGSNYAGGNAQFGGEVTLYNNCMFQTGWAVSKHMF